MEQKTLVSIICTCKNGARTIHRCLDSVLAQDYPHIEIIVQDGVSTDGTLEILRGYGDRIKLVSKPDTCSLDGSLRAMRRSSGEIIGFCLADEEYLPHAVSWAVENMETNPDAGAIYGDYYTSDIEGNILSANTAYPFTLEDYICHRVVPPFCSSFFRKNCLEAVGLYDHEWSFDCGEFELWTRLAWKYAVRYIPGLVSKFGEHPESSTSQTSMYYSQISGRYRMLNLLLDDPATPDHIRALKSEAFAGLHLWIANAFTGIQVWEEAREQVLKALEFKPQPAQLGTMLQVLGKHGVELLREGKPQEALSFFDISLVAPFPYLQYFRAIALMSLTRYPEAQEAIQAELIIQPHNQDVINIAATIARHLPDERTRMEEAAPPTNGREEYPFSRWIDRIARVENRLYYRDQTPASLRNLYHTAKLVKPTKIVELGTLSGLSLRTWLLAADRNANIIAVDLSFKALHDSTKIIPLDIERVILIERDILALNLADLWNRDDKVLLYIDAHDLPDVPIMEHVLQSGIPTLPPGSMVMVDDLWYSPDTLTEANAGQFFSDVVIHEIDPLQCFDGYYASYWKGGYFLGFMEVVPLLQWVNDRKIDLIFSPGVKSVAFTVDNEKIPSSSEGRR
jgi:glycosyltransferase involved in cell wall biosynthesis/predicted O-methyltransferase YrrM